MREPLVQPLIDNECLLQEDLLPALSLSSLEAGFNGRAELHVNGERLDHCVVAAHLGRSPEAVLDTLDEHGPIPVYRALHASRIEAVRSLCISTPQVRELKGFVRTLRESIIPALSAEEPVGHEEICGKVRGIEWREKSELGREVLREMYDGEHYFAIIKRLGISRTTLDIIYDHFMTSSAGRAPDADGLTSIDINILHLAVRGNAHSDFAAELNREACRKLDSRFRLNLNLGIIGGLAAVSPVFAAAAGLITPIPFAPLIALGGMVAVIGRKNRLNAVFYNNIAAYASVLASTSPWHIFDEPCQPFPPPCGSLTDLNAIRMFFSLREVAVLVRALRLFNVDEKKIISGVASSPPDETGRSPLLRRMLAECVSEWGIADQRQFSAIYKALRAREYFHFQFSRLQARDAMRKRLLSLPGESRFRRPGTKLPLECFD